MTKGVNWRGSGANMMDNVGRGLSAHSFCLNLLVLLILGPDVLFPTYNGLPLSPPDFITWYDQQDPDHDGHFKTHGYLGSHVQLFHLYWGPVAH